MGLLSVRHNFNEMRMNLKNLADLSSTVSGLSVVSVAFETALVLMMCVVIQFQMQPFTDTFPMSVWWKSWVVYPHLSLLWAAIQDFKHLNTEAWNNFQVKQGPEKDQEIWDAAPVFDLPCTVNMTSDKISRVGLKMSWHTSGTIFSLLLSFNLTPVSCPSVTCHMFHACKDNHLN